MEGLAGKKVSGVTVREASDGRLILRGPLQVGLVLGAAGAVLIAIGIGLLLDVQHGESGTSVFRALRPLGLGLILGPGGLWLLSSFTIDKSGVTRWRMGIVKKVWKAEEIEAVAIRIIASSPNVQPWCHVEVRSPRGHLNLGIGWNTKLADAGVTAQIGREAARILGKKIVVDGVLPTNAHPSLQQALAGATGAT